MISATFLKKKGTMCVNNSQMQTQPCYFSFFRDVHDFGALKRCKTCFIRFSQNNRQVLLIKQVRQCLIIYFGTLITNHSIRIQTNHLLESYQLPRFRFFLNKKYSI